MFHWKVWLDIPVRRLRCLSCGITTEKIDWQPERQHYTTALATWGSHWFVCFRLST
ncbi:hypothetical protein [Pectobacterium brasiliense]|uniref:hypothetical protein n=1 Tax=Pectobacterium brasiliense TaxID=180957 RepID=UPI001969315E|nr:hypothetical protein [Pectobacterium brasiliense]MBN3264728.1 hypothetical protein [Pectobacterium brasiliense]